MAMEGDFEEEDRVAGWRVRCAALEAENRRLAAALKEANDWRDEAARQLIRAEVAEMALALSADWEVVQ